MNGYKKSNSHSNKKRGYPFTRVGEGNGNGDANRLAVIEKFTLKCIVCDKASNTRTNCLGRDSCFKCHQKGHRVKLAALRNLGILDWIGLVSFVASIFMLCLIHI